MALKLSLYDAVLTAFDGSGGFSRLRSWVADAAAGLKIKADLHDTEDDNFAAGLSQCITRDGQSNVSADIPFGGHKLINVGDPVNPQDAATKRYADAIRSFATSLTVSGNAAEGRLNFTGTGTVGISFTHTLHDLAFGVRDSVPEDGDDPAIPARFVWNDRSDFSGADIATMSETGQLVLGAAGLPAGGRSNLYAPGEITVNNRLCFNEHYDTVSARWEHLATGWAAHWALNLSNGQVTLMRSNDNRAAEEAFDPSTALVYWTSDLIARFPTSIMAGNAVYDPSGNITGPVWLGYGTGYSDAYNAINQHILNMTTTLRAEIDALRAEVADLRARLP